MKRFYKTVSTAPAPDTQGHWRVELDGRPIRTAGGRAQVVPGKPLADALAAEWDAQGDTIEPKTFALRDLVDFAIDAVAPAPGKAIDELIPYAETDTLCYRADPEEALYRRQLEIWDPVLLGLEKRLDVRFERVSGILHKPQSEATLLKLRRELESENAVRLAALRMLASLAASLVIALEAVQEKADAEYLWRAANLEEDWQIELWGEDAEAAERRLARFEAFKLAMRVAELAGKP